MKNYLKLILVAGARPNFMKIAPLIWRIEEYNKDCYIDEKVEFCLVHTGQHYDKDMSEVFFKELNMPKPNFNLGSGSGSHAAQTADIMKKFEPICVKEKPDYVVVVGDVNSTMACTLVASKIGIRVAHVEAGLRSYDRSMPEEINRVVTDALSDLLLTPSNDANLNLKREGIAKSKIFLVGNIMIDTLIKSIKKADNSKIANRLDLKSKEFAYVTLHRPFNVDENNNLSLILKELIKLSKECKIIFPVHPRTRKRIAELFKSIKGISKIKIVEPIGYYDSIYLTKNARVVITDSGGLQEESTFFRTPCLTLRPNTERPITIKLGTNKLTNIKRLPDDIKQIFKNPYTLGKIPPYWDGLTANRILKVLNEKK
jgi:UDP-N-acetylglucosamine 2-epimerase (non-hydrolysing)